LTGWQRDYQRAEDELDDPRSLALPNWEALEQLAAALVTRSADHFAGWGETVMFAASTAARIGEVSGARRADIDCASWMWTVRRQTTPSPGGLIDKGTKGRRERTVPLIVEIRPLIETRLTFIGSDPLARLFTGPAWRAHYHCGAARCNALGRGSHPARLPIPAPPRSQAYRPDLDG